MSEPGAERRLNRRHPLILTVDYGDGPADWTENVSASGIFINSARQFERGSELGLSVGFPGALEPLAVSGEIAWVRPASSWSPAGFGIDVGDGGEALNALAVAADGEEPSAVEAMRVLSVRLELEPAAWGGVLDLVGTRSADEALMRAQQHRPSVILTPLFAPMPDCLRMLKSLRDKSAAKVVASSSGDADDDARAGMAGVAAVLPADTRWDNVLHTLAAVQRTRP